jgi:hypothetical protein
MRISAALLPWNWKLAQTRPATWECHQLRPSPYGYISAAIAEGYKRMADAAGPSGAHVASGDAPGPCILRASPLSRLAPHWMADGELVPSTRAIQFTCAPENCTTLAHFSVSAAIVRP